VGFIVRDHGASAGWQEGSGAAVRDHGDSVVFLELWIGCRAVAPLEEWKGLIYG
jgi:hypothetical protein